MNKKHIRRNHNMNKRKMKYKSKKGRTNWTPLFPEPQDEYERYLNENELVHKKGPYEI